MPCRPLSPASLVFLHELVAASQVAAVNAFKRDHCLLSVPSVPCVCRRRRRLLPVAHLEAPCQVFLRCAVLYLVNKLCRNSLCFRVLFPLLIVWGYFRYASCVSAASWLQVTCTNGSLVSGVRQVRIILSLLIGGKNVRARPTGVPGVRTKGRPCVHR